MKTGNKHSLYALRADASAVGGYLDEPIERQIPTLAPVSLPAVGGFAMARSEGFTFEEIVSCSAAYTRVSGRESTRDGSSSLLVTAVVENLNILEVVRARRIVTQLEISIPGEPGPIGISLAGSGFEGLHLAGHECRAKLSSGLQSPGDANGDGLLRWEDVRQVGSTQGGYARASLVDTLEGASRCRGHIVDIPEFGQIILGELLISRNAVQLIGIRAELGCTNGGRISVCCGGGGGSNDD
jgi:hypothetical protein